MNSTSLPAFIWGKTPEQTGYHEIAAHAAFPKDLGVPILEQLKKDFNQLPPNDNPNKPLIYAALYPVQEKPGWLFIRLLDQGRDQWQRPGTLRLEAGWYDAALKQTQSPNELKQQLQAWLLDYPYWQLLAGASESESPLLKLSTAPTRLANITQCAVFDTFNPAQHILIGPQKPIQSQSFPQWCLAPELLPNLSLSEPPPPPVTTRPPGKPPSPPVRSAPIAPANSKTSAWGGLIGVALLGIVLGGGIMGSIYPHLFGQARQTVTMTPEAEMLQTLMPYLTRLTQTHITTYCKAYDCTGLQQALGDDDPPLQLFWQQLPTSEQAIIKDLWGQYATQAVSPTALQTWQAWRATSWQLYQQLAVLSDNAQTLLLRALQQHAEQYQHPLLTQPNLSVPWLTRADTQMMQRLQQILLAVEQYNNVVKIQLQQLALDCTENLPTLHYQICRYQQLLPVSNATHFLMHKWQRQLTDLQQQLTSLK